MFSICETILDLESILNGIVFMVSSFAVLTEGDRIK